MSRVYEESVVERSKFKKSCVMDVICQYQLIIIHGAAKKGECVILKVKHPTGLHGYKGSKKNKDADCSNSQKSASTLAYATTKLKSKIVTMCVVPVNVATPKRNSKLMPCWIVAVREPSLAHT